MREKIAFLIHPWNNVADDMGQLFGRAASLVPTGVYERTFARLRLPPVVTGRLRYDDAPRENAGWLITVPLAPRQLLGLPRARVRAQIDAAVDRARDLGATLVGLGGLTAPATLGGKTIAARTDIGVTNGNAFTAAMTLRAVQELLQRCPRGATIALVGATGSVGACLTHLLATRHDGPLLLVARNESRLNALRDACRAQGADARASTDMTSVRSADLVVLLTSAAEAVLHSEHLKHGAIVLDDTQPRNTDPALVRERPDVLIVDGGLVSVPGMRLRGTVGLPRGLAFACLAETMLLGLNGHRGHYSIGAPTTDQAEQMLHLAHQHRALGFHLAPLHSFGTPVDPMSVPALHGAPA